MKNRELAEFILLNFAITVLVVAAIYYEQKDVKLDISRIKPVQAVYKEKAAEEDYSAELSDTLVSDENGTYESKSEEDTEGETVAFEEIDAGNEETQTNRTTSDLSEGRGETEVFEDKESDTYKPDSDIKEEDNPKDEDSTQESPPEEIVKDDDIVIRKGFIIDGEGMIISFTAEDVTVDEGYLELPFEDCVGIRSGAFCDFPKEVCELYIPSNISVLEPGWLAGLSGLEYIEVDENNPYFSSVYGVVHSRDLRTLVSFPYMRTGAYKIEPSVEHIADYAFADTMLIKLDMSDNGVITLGENIFGASNGNGIQIVAPSGLEEVYRENFRAYNVELARRGL